MTGMVSTILVLGAARVFHFVPLLRFCPAPPPLPHKQTKMSTLIKKFIPHRLSRGLKRGALAGLSLAGGVKLATALRNRPNTSRTTTVKRAGVRLRIGTLNVGSMRGRAGEVVDMAERRRLDFCCLQETRWRGGSAKTYGKYKFFWKGGEDGLAGVGVLVQEKWVENVIGVQRINERILVLRVRIGGVVVNVVSVYAPQMGRSLDEKEEFYNKLGIVLESVPAEEGLFV